jgi:hypothetical protein
MVKKGDFLLLCIGVGWLAACFYVVSIIFRSSNNERTRTDRTYDDIITNLVTLQQKITLLKDHIENSPSIPRVEARFSPKKLNSIGNTSNNKKTATVLASSTESQKIVRLPEIKRKLKAVLYTMDSISSYEANSLQGGAAGLFLWGEMLYVF